MTDFPDDIYAPTSLAQPPADTDIDQAETTEADPPGRLYRMSQRLGARIRMRRGFTGGYLRLMD